MRRATSTLRETLGPLRTQHFRPHPICERAKSLETCGRSPERAEPAAGTRIACGMGASGAALLLATPTGSIGCCCHRCPLKVPAWRACPEGRKTQTCRRGTARVLRIAESAKRVNDDQHFCPVFDAVHPSACAPLKTSSRPKNRSLTAMRSGETPALAVVVVAACSFVCHSRRESAFSRSAGPTVSTNAKTDLRPLELRKGAFIRTNA